VTNLALMIAYGINVVQKEIPAMELMLEGSKST
jgi:hypothetical protein